MMRKIKVNEEKHLVWLNLRCFKTLMCEQWSEAGYYADVRAIFSLGLALWSCRCSSIHITQLLSLDKLGFQPLALHICGYSEDCFTSFTVGCGFDQLFDTLLGHFTLISTSALILTNMLSFYSMSRANWYSPAVCCFRYCTVAGIVEGSGPAWAHIVAGCCSNRIMALWSNTVPDLTCFYQIRRVLWAH